MLNNIMLGKYYNNNSKIHYMHPLSKIICAILFIIMVVICNNIKLMILLSLLAVFFTEMAHTPKNIYLKIINSLKFILLFILIAGLTFKIDIVLIIINTLKIISIVLYISVLTLTTPAIKITYGLILFFLPLKFIGLSVNKIALSISLVLRFIPTLIDQGNKILKIQSSRGIDYYNLKGRLIRIKSMIILMFVTTLKKFKDFTDLMAVRLYNVDDKRTNFKINKWYFFDTYMVIIHIVILVLIMYKFF